MVLQDVQTMSGLQVENKAFLAFERRSGQQGIKGIYILEFDRQNGSAIEEPDAALEAAPKVIDAVKHYDDRDIDRIYLYANKAGTELTVTLISRPVGNSVFVYTGRVVNGVYTACSDPAEVQGNWKSSFGFYYDDKTKNKFILFDTGRILAEAH
jgi:hypothetical protein